MKCEKCGEKMEPVVDEVDIGVGIQTFIRGYECKCGELIALCDLCAYPLPTHREWCRELPV